jgi:hypothetical protein
MIMSKNFESTFKTINLRLRCCHSIEQIKPIQTLNFHFCSPEVEERNAVEVDNWAKHKKSFYSE